MENRKTSALDFPLRKLSLAKNQRSQQTSLVNYKLRVARGKIYKLTIFHIYLKVCSTPDGFIYVYRCMCMRRKVMSYIIPCGREVRGIEDQWHCPRNLRGCSCASDVWSMGSRCLPSGQRYLCILVKGRLRCWIKKEPQDFETGQGTSGTRCEIYLYGRCTLTSFVY